MREPRRFPRPSRHVTPSQKASSPEKLTRPISQKSAPSPRLAVERLHPQIRKTCRENPLQPQPQPRIHETEKHVALQKNIHSPYHKGARRLAARGRTVASTNQENMSRKSTATATATFAFTKQKNMSPFRKAHIRHPPKERAALCGSRSNGCVHKSGKHVAKIPCNRNRNRNRLDDCSCLLLICYRTDGNIVWVLRKS